MEEWKGKIARCAKFLRRCKPRIPGILAKILESCERILEFRERILEFCSRISESPERIPQF
jgi:hypothetical protein